MDQVTPCGWPALAAVSASETAWIMTAQFLEMMSNGGPTPQLPEGVTSKSSRNYKRYELATGGFVALGQRVELSRLRLPTYLLAGNADDVVTAKQLFAVARLVGTQPEYLREQVAPSNHLGQFMGKRTLKEYWPGIAGWLKEPLPHASRGNEDAACEVSGSGPPSA